ncbi:MAG: hypothetical protein HUJ52_00865 [Malacoplasma sp.]|nr:hypothetical protein [Malacoplasma sp.]
MYELIKLDEIIACKEVVASPVNFNALEESIAEISETDNICNEKEFFDLYEIKILKLD